MEKIVGVKWMIGYRNKRRFKNKNFNFFFLFPIHPILNIYIFQIADKK